MDSNDALSNEDKATYASGNAIAIEILERRIERRLAEFRTRLVIVEERMTNVLESSRDNNQKLRRLEIFFWILIGLGGGNFLALVSLLAKAAQMVPK